MSDRTPAPNPGTGPTFCDAGSGGASVGVTAAEEHTTEKPLDPARPEGLRIERTSYGWEPRRAPTVRILPPRRDFAVLRPRARPRRDVAHHRPGARRAVSSRGPPADGEDEPPGEHLGRAYTFRAHRRRHFHLLPAEQLSAFWRLPERQQAEAWAGLRRSVENQRAAMATQRRAA
jgi:hypothetical protein